MFGRDRKFRNRWIYTFLHLIMKKVSCCPRECSCQGQPHQPARMQGPYSGFGLGSTQASLAGRSSLASRPAAAAIGGPAACGVGVIE